jgi:hypothetical protein
MPGRRRTFIEFVAALRLPHFMSTNNGGLRGLRIDQYITSMLWKAFVGVRCCDRAMPDASHAKLREFLFRWGTVATARRRGCSLDGLCLLGNCWSLRRQEVWSRLRRRHRRRLQTFLVAIKVEESSLKER